MLAQLKHPLVQIRNKFLVSHNFTDFIEFDRPDSIDDHCMLVHISPYASMVIDFFELTDLLTIQSILNDAIITRLSFLNYKKSGNSDSRFALAYRYFVEADI